MSRPEPDWIEHLPTGRTLAEFSLWSASLLHIGADLERIAPYADALHVDVADGHFAPAFLLFPDLIAQVRAASSIPIHVHLMVDDAIVLAQVEQFADAGADAITVHGESRHLAAALERIGARGLVPGVVLKVETPVEVIAPCLDRVRLVTLLGTAIGVKGKGLHEAALDRLAQARRLIEARGAGRRIVLVADGGIREETVPLLVKAGAEAVVMGSLAFGAPDLAARMRWLHRQ